LLELDTLFHKRDWEIIDNIDAKKSLYQRYCERLKYLEEKEQNFFIELSYDFEIIGIKDYLEFFLMSLFNIDEIKFESVEKIIFTPLTKPFIDNKVGRKKILRPKTKSSQFLFSYIDRHDLRWIDHSSKFEFIESIIDIKKLFVSDKTLIVLVDDFVGTGKTAINCVKTVMQEIQADLEITKDDICVMAIAALSEGVTKLKDDLGVIVYSDIIRKKGITDCYSDEEGIEKKELMLEIEKKLKCPGKYSFGFEQSEALITFGDKTPNNTFPAYWHETETRIAPFPRYKNYK
jgi:uracil phosphoribosyltransferase